MEHLVDHNEWFIREVEKGLVQADSGEALEGDEVVARIENLIARKQQSS
jgi:predicted transcriptional regulator